MRIVEGADWRDELAFEHPVRVVDIAPGEPARCVLCGSEAPLHPRDELWAVKHRHPTRHGGYVRFYCAAHRPAPPARVEAPAPAARKSVRRERAAAPARVVVPEVPRAVCPTCFVEVPSSGMCGICGERVA